MKELSSRQRELADEKAQVEDARGALELQTSSLATLAGEQRECTTGLAELLNRYAAEDFAWVDANAARRERDVREGPERLRRLPGAVRMNRGLGICALVVLVLVGGAVAVLGFRVVPQPAASAAPKVKALKADARRTLRAEPKQLARDSEHARPNDPARAQHLLLRRGHRLGLRHRRAHHHHQPGTSCRARRSWSCKWTGVSLDADVNEASTGRGFVDIGVTRVSAGPAGDSAELGSDPREGDRVTAVGYPLGGPLMLSAGRVTRDLDGRSLAEVAFDGKVLAGRMPEKATSAGSVRPSR